MAITNAQQYKQLLAKGGRIGFKGGADASEFGKSGSNVNVSSSGSVSKSKSVSPGGGNSRRGDDGPDDRSSALQTYNTKKATGRLGRQDANQMDSTIFYGPKGEAIDIGYQGPLNERETRGKTFLETEPEYNKYVPGYLKMLANFSNTPNRKYFYENVIRAGKIPGLNYDEEELEKAYNTYMANRLAGKTDAMGNPVPGFSYEDGMLTGNFIDSGGDNDYVPPVIPEDDTTEEDPTVPRNLGGLAPRFAGSIFDFTGLADGGRAGYMDGGRMMNDDDPTGGIMDLESGRQMYFLGKLVKKATRAVKKIAKSPFGKAALGAALFKFGGGFGGGSGTGILSKLKTGLIGKLSGGDENIFKGGKFSGIANFLRDQYTSDGGKLKFGLGLGLGVPFALDALGVGKNDDKKMNLDEYYKTQGIDVDYIRRHPFSFSPASQMGSLYNFADGGRTGYQEGGDAEPVAKKTMPLLDMDGQEMDLRAEGGFVPLGRMERADDVPARLSKNEFVFTADAVRNAGEGDIDKGAEVMYNMMKNLESGGEVSEESQGLDGAREMFKTSQRLEEVL